MMTTIKRKRKIYGTRKPFTKGSYHFNVVNEKGETKSVQVDFSKGRTNPNYLPGRFMTEDPYLQKAIENSMNYGRYYELLKAYPISQDMPNVVAGRAATTGDLSGSLRTPQIKTPDDAPATEVLELGKPTGQPAIDGLEPENAVKAVYEPEVTVDETPDSEGQVIPTEGLEAVVNGVTARQWILKNLPWVRPGDVNNNTKIKAVAQEAKIEFPNWED